MGWGRRVFSPERYALGWAWDSYLAVPCVVPGWEEDASVWPHAGHGAGEEDDMGRVAP